MSEMPRGSDWLNSKPDWDQSWAVWSQRKTDPKSQITHCQKNFLKDIFKLHWLKQFKLIRALVRGYIKLTSAILLTAPSMVFPSTFCEAGLAYDTSESSANDLSISPSSTLNGLCGRTDFSSRITVGILASFTTCTPPPSADNNIATWWSVSQRKTDSYDSLT